MKSVLASRKKFTPTKVTLEGGIKLVQPMATGRATPAKKTAVKIDNSCCQTPCADGP